MNVTIIGRKCNPREDFRSRVEKRLLRVEKLFGEDAVAKVTATVEKNYQAVEVTLNKGGMIFRAEVEDTEAKAAIDRIVDIIERQIRKNKTRLAKRLRENSLDDMQLISGTDYVDAEDDNEFSIVKTKRFAIKPMSTEEAILQMKLLGHDFYVFKNLHTNEMNVVYTRKDGKYALIESVE